MSDEKEKLWREEYFKYCEEKGITVLGVKHLEFYLAACKKRQEEIDIENSIIKEYREQCILNAEELTTLRANHEKMFRDMGKEIRVRNNHVRELKTSNEQLRAELDRMIESDRVRFELVMAHGHEIHRLKGLVKESVRHIKSVKKYIHEVENDDERFYLRWASSVEQFLKDSEVVGE